MPFWGTKQPPKTCRGSGRDMSTVGGRARPDVRSRWTFCFALCGAILGCIAVGMEIVQLVRSQPAALATASRYMYATARPPDVAQLPPPPALPPAAQPPPPSAAPPPSPLPSCSPPPPSPPPPPPTPPPPRPPAIPPPPPSRPPTRVADATNVADEAGNEDDDAADAGDGGGSDGGGSKLGGAEGGGGGGEGVGDGESDGDGVAEVRPGGKRSLPRGTTAVATTAGGRPHLMLMVADDLDPSDVSLLRSFRADETASSSLTPNIDSVVRGGAVFSKAHAAAPLCAPSRFAILTGLRPQCAHTATALRTAATAAATSAAVPPSVSYDTAPRPSRHPTLAHRLAALGCATRASDRTS
jgi:hypothetical protein